MNDNPSSQPEPQRPHGASRQEPTLPRAVSQVRPPVDAFDRPLAHWWKRAAAFVIDAVVVVVLTVIVVFVGRLLRVQLLSVLGVLTQYVYFTWLNGNDRGQTVGKMALKIQVRRAHTGGPIGGGKAFSRLLLMQLLLYAGGVPGIIDALFPLWDRRRQTLHDKLIRTVVIDVA